MSVVEVQSVLADFIDKYGPGAGPTGPLLFVQEVLGVETVDNWQTEALLAFGREERRISIRACHGPGKTAFAAWCVLYNLLFRFPQRTVATAPSRGQLEGALVAEVNKWLDQLPPKLKEVLDPKSTSVKFLPAPKRSSFEARTARPENPEALQGIHEDDGWVLLIADEASGIDEKIFESAGGSMSGDNCQTILLSNPVRTSGLFFDSHHKLKDIWHTIHISAADSSRVTDDFVEDMARRYGKDSNAYRVRVLGEFPSSDLDTIVPWDYVESARDRDIIVPRSMPTIWGVDVARFGDDRNALAKRNRIGVLPDLQEWGGVDLMQTAGRVKREFDETLPSERPEEILVDVIGLGAGVVDRLQEQRLPVRGINVAEVATHHEQYRNLRTELWFAAREWLMKRDVTLPRCEGGCARDCIHEKLASELVSTRYEYASTGKYIAETKAKMKKRGVKSPNIAEAVIMTFASEPAGFVHGSRDGFGSGWNETLTRGRSIV
jgi:hypothetical protein